MGTWTGTLPDMLGLQVLTAAQWQEITGALAALSGAWTDYTPVWTAATTNPDVGTNGSKTGRYLQVGKFVLYTGRILAGSDTTFGSGLWKISLPVNAKDGTLHVGSALCYDASTESNRRPAAVWMFDATSLRFSAGGDVASGTPFTWTSSDQLRWTTIYEAA